MWRLTIWIAPAPLHEPDAMITQIRKARRCWDPNQVVVNGICEFDARRVPPAKRKCIAWNEGLCGEYYGMLKGWRARESRVQLTTNFTRSPPNHLPRFVFRFALAGLGTFLGRLPRLGGGGGC